MIYSGGKNKQKTKQEMVIWTKIKREEQIVE